ncbi:hypothetical protein GGI20_006322 [Coemansia sp. BCRC 34301]|nr:hypothetical protein GGI20_006322 [Coemansia sp. BCRC 34301]
MASTPAGSFQFGDMASTPAGSFSFGFDTSNNTPVGSFDLGAMDTSFFGGNSVAFTSSTGNLANAASTSFSIFGVSDATGAPLYNNPNCETMVAFSDDMDVDQFMEAVQFISPQLLAEAHASAIAAGIIVDASTASSLDTQAVPVVPDERATTTPTTSRQLTSEDAGAAAAGIIASMRMANNSSAQAVPVAPTEHAVSISPTPTERTVTIPSTPTEGAISAPATPVMSAATVLAMPRYAADIGDPGKGPSAVAGSSRSAICSESNTVTSNKRTNNFSVRSNGKRARNNGKQAVCQD